MTLPENITAPRLRVILSVAMVLLFLAGGGVFYLGYTQLSETAAEVGEQVATAKQSESTIQRLETLQSELESKKDVVSRVSQVTADSQNYAYQDRLVNDLTVYANRANLTIKNISFSSQTASGGGGVPTPEAAPNPDGAAADEGQIPGATGTPPAAGASLKTATVDITLESPVNYEDLLNFLHYIEENLTKLKLSRVVLTKSDADSVTIDVLNLEVYLK